MKLSRVLDVLGDTEITVIDHDGRALFSGQADEVAGDISKSAVALITYYDNCVSKIEDSGSEIFITLGLEEDLMQEIVKE